MCLHRGEIKQPRNMGAYQGGAVRKASNFSKTVQRPVRWSGPRSLDDYAHLLHIIFKSPASDVVVAFVFHLLHALQEILKPSHICSSWASYSCNVTPLPAIPHNVLMHPRNSFSVPSIVLLCHHRKHMSPLFHNAGTERRAGSSLSAFQPLAISLC